MTHPHLTNDLQVTQAYALFFQRHMGTLEIAKMLGVSEATVYNTLAHRMPGTKLPPKEKARSVGARA